MKQEEKYISAIKELLGGVAKNTSDGVITDVNLSEPIGVLSEHNTIYLSANGRCFLYADKSEISVGLEELGLSELEFVFTFLDANKHNLLVRDSVYEHETADSINFRVGPFDVVADDGQVIGSVGIAVEEQTPEEVEMALFFISVDTTWARLAVWKEGEEESMVLAKEDIKKIIGSLTDILSYIK